MATVCGTSLALMDAGVPIKNAVSGPFGINLIVYSLTGNYKSDQVHVPEILKRMKNK